MPSSDFNLFNFLVLYGGTLFAFIFGVVAYYLIVHKENGQAKMHRVLTRSDREMHRYIQERHPQQEEPPTPQDAPQETTQEELPAPKGKSRLDFLLSRKRK